MDFQASLLRQLENPKLSYDQRAELRCQLARELEESGDHEAARQAMGELWQRVGERPKVEGLEPSVAGEVLLRAGVLTGWLGSSNQIGEAQETAKNLISEAIAIFESLSYTKKVLEAQTELSLCYWRTGEYGEARIILQGVLAKLTANSELKAKAILRLAIVEWGANNYSDALRILIDAAPLFEKINSHVLKGSYHNQLAMVFRSLATSEKQEECLDRALIEYAAASFHFEQAGHVRYQANVENNLGFLFFKLGTFKEAHEHLDHARRLATSLKDRVHTARIDETRARVFLAQKKNAEAERVVRTAVNILEQGGHYAILAEAQITHGTALARLGYYRQSLSAFQRAIEVAELSGALNRAGEAALTMIEELGEHLIADERKASENLVEEVQRYERGVIKRALMKAEGSVTRAARLLGVSHQRLIYIIKKRHKDLLSVRTPTKRRHKSIIKRK
ncbi:MAG TPA: tetratricopeptide repeat protein [Pyrinomonadaceae bacterium]|jgi:tetratricopeptide (TPR) repeat protein